MGSNQNNATPGTGAVDAGLLSASLIATFFENADLGFIENFVGEELKHGA